jgi:ATP-dependent protease ClpP protease subunit
MSRRKTAAGTVTLPAGSGLPRRVPTNTAKADSSRPGDWFRIQNHGSESDTTEVYIYDEIGFWGTTAQDFVQQLMQIETSHIDLHLNSPGGEVFDGVAIYNALKSHPASVTVYVDALAASAASFIAQSGDKVVMAPASTMMIHDAMGICLGNAQDMKDSASILDHVSNNIASIYAASSGGTVPEWRAMMQQESWYNPQEAVDAGLADEIANEATNSSASNHWDLSVYNFAGRQNAPSPDSVRRSVVNKIRKGAVNMGSDDKAADTSTEDAGQSTDDKAGKGADDKSEPPTEPVAPVVPAQPENKATTGGTLAFIINGVRETDPAKVQAYITTLEGAQDDARIQNRKAFIKQLCDAKKITAAQVAGYEELVLGTDDEPGMTEKQFARWAATWDMAPVQMLLSVRDAGNLEVEGGGNAIQENQPHLINSAKPSKADELEIKKGIVRSNRGVMPKAQLEQTNSWKWLVEHGVDPNTI